MVWHDPEKWRRFQDSVVWMIGACGLANELLVQPRPRPEAIPVIFLVLGLPFARKADREQRRS